MQADAKSNMTEQKQLPVFKAAELQGTPAEYQKRLRLPFFKQEPKPVIRYETSEGMPVALTSRPASSSTPKSAASATGVPPQYDLFYAL